MRTLLEIVSVIVITLGLCERYGADPSRFASDARIVGEAAELLGEVIKQGGRCLQGLSVLNESTDTEV